MCSFNQSSPYILEKEGKVSIDIEKKHQYHTVVYVTCNTCGKSYSRRSPWLSSQLLVLF